MISSQVWLNLQFSKPFPSTKVNPVNRPHCSTSDKALSKSDAQGGRNKMVPNNDFR